MNYGALLSGAFRISLRNPFLWFFGFFVVGGPSFGFNNFSTGPEDAPGGAPGGVPGGAPVPPPAEPPPAWLQNPERFFYDNLGTILAVAALGLLLLLIFISLTIVSVGTLPESVAALQRGERRRFTPAFGAGLRTFWRVLGQRLLFVLISLVLFLVVFVPILLLFLALSSSVTPESIGPVLLFVFLGALLGLAVYLVIFVPVYIIGQLALRGLVLNGGGVFDSIGDGYRLFRRNLGRSLVIWLIQVAVAIAVIVILFVVSIIVGIVQFALITALPPSGYATAALISFGLLVTIPGLLLSGVFGAFNSGYWTLAYLQLTNLNAETPSQTNQEVL